MQIKGPPSSWRLHKIFVLQPFSKQITRLCGGDIFVGDGRACGVCGGGRVEGGLIGGGGGSGVRIHVFGEIGVDVGQRPDAVIFT